MVKKGLAALALAGMMTLASLAALAAPKIALEFAGADPVKYNSAAGMKGIKMEEGVLRGTISASDPSFGFSFTKLKASTDDTPLFSVMMKVDATAGKPFTNLKLYFSTSEEKNLDEAKTVLVEGILCDGEWHEYKAEMDSNKLWTGDLQQLRFDFEYIGDASFAGTIVYLDWLHMEY